MLRISPRQLLDLLIRYFGNEREALRFMRYFSPNVLHIPTTDVIEILSRDRRICESLMENPSIENIRRLSQFHGIDNRTTIKTVKKLKGLKMSDLRRDKASK